MAQTSKEAIVSRINEIAERVALQNGIEIVELDLLGGGKARVLRITIDKPEGVTHADCESISRQVGAVLDAEDVIPGEGYSLEVSSPGVERKLTKPADFQRFSGQKIKVSLVDPVEEQRYWEGTLKGFEENGILLEPVEGRLLRIPLESIRKANLKFEWQ